MARLPHGFAEAPSRPSTTILAVTIFVGQDRCVKPIADGNLLHTVDRIGDDTATDLRRSELLAPKLLTIAGIEHVEMAAHITEEHEPPGCRR